MRKSLSGLLALAFGIAIVLPLCSCGKKKDEGGGTPPPANVKMVKPAAGGAGGATKGADAKAD